MPYSGAPGLWVACRDVFVALGLGRDQVGAGAQLVRPGSGGVLRRRRGERVFVCAEAGVLELGDGQSIVQRVAGGERLLSETIPADGRAPLRDRADRRWAIARVA